MIRRSPLTHKAELKTGEKKLRTRKCAVCRSPFVPRSMTHKACGPEYAAVVAKLDREKKERTAAAADRAETKRKLEAMKGINKLKAEAQKVFNAFIRERDRDLPCICCGKFATAAALAQPGGAYDACHYRSRGSADHLRFNENNVHRGLKDCNTWGHKDYRSGLIARIGLEAVEALEADQTVIKWTKDELRAIKAEYQAKLKALMNNKGVV